MDQCLVQINDNALLVLCVRSLGGQKKLPVLYHLWKGGGRGGGREGKEGK